MNGEYHVERCRGVIWAKRDSPTLESDNKAKHYCRREIWGVYFALYKISTDPSIASMAGTISLDVAAST